MKCARSATNRSSLLKTFADQAVIAIENVRLFEEVQARTAELSEALQQQTATADVLKVISRSAFDLQPVFETLVEFGDRLCGAEQGRDHPARGRRSAVHGRLRPSRRSFAPTRRRIRTSSDAGRSMGRAAIEGTTIHVPDVARGPGIRTTGDRADRRHSAPSSAVPLKRGAEVIGVFVMARATAGPFTPRQIELVETFADQAVIAIENVRLFEEVQARNRDLTESLERQTAMSDILRVISRSPTDVQPVFETIAESAARLCSARFCTVFRFDGELIHFAAQHGLPPEASRSAAARLPDASRTGKRRRRARFSVRRSNRSRM